MITATSAQADTYWYCKDGECVGVSKGLKAGADIEEPMLGTEALGTYEHPLQIN